MSEKVEFKHPYFVTNHSIERFQEKIYNLKPKEIIILIQLWLQDGQNNPIEIYSKNNKLCATYRFDFGDKPVYVIVAANSGQKWPTVITVCGEESKIHGNYLKGELKYG